MRIKTIKVRASNDSRDFAISDFYSQNSTIYSTNSKLIKEKDDYYWLVMIAYESNLLLPLEGYNSSNSYQLPAGFEQSVMHYVVNTPSNGVRIKNSVSAYLPSLLEINSINDFKCLRGLGVKTVEENIEFLSGLMDIIKQYQ